MRIDLLGNGLEITDSRNRTICIECNTCTDGTQSLQFGVIDPEEDASTWTEFQGDDAVDCLSAIQHWITSLETDNA